MVELTWTWDEPPSLDVERLDDTIVVRVHAGLSERQIADACATLGEDGPSVYAAWSDAVGFRSPGPAT